VGYERGVSPRKVGRVVPGIDDGYSSAFGLDKRIADQLPISLNCVFDASLVPETCLELSRLPECGLRMRFGKLRPLNDMALRARR
jgi:hypothetical protein